MIIFCSSAQSKKLWPTGDWIRLCKFLSSNGFTCQFTWGNPDEYAICKHIISASSGELLPNMPINDIAAQINRSCLVVGLDTGLLHLATALEVPTIAIFGASDPIKTGPPGVTESSRSVVRKTTFRVRRKLNQPSPPLAR